MSDLSPRSPPQKFQSWDEKLKFAIVPKANNVEEVRERPGYSFVEAILAQRNSETNALEYRVAWSNWTINCMSMEHWLATWRFDHTDIIEFFESRKRVEVRLSKKQVDEMGLEEFERTYPTYKDRFIYKGLGQATTAMMVNRLYIRRKENQWNERLSLTGEAQIMIMNWTEIPAEFHFKIVHNVMIRESLKREMILLAPEPEYLQEEFGAHCTCVGKCKANCPCGITHGGIRMRAGHVNMETVTPGSYFVSCGPQCSCSDDCPRKFPQRGRKHKMILFYMGVKKGWGLLAGEKIPKGSFMGHYFGELKRIDYGSSEGIDLTYQFDLVNDNLLGGYSIDALRHGNETRFFNNSCKPNMMPFNIYQAHNKLMNMIGFITTEDVAFGEELTFRYSQKGGEKDGTKCLCRRGCTSRL